LPNTYFSISKNSEGLFKDRGSKFIAKAFPVQNEEEIKSIQAELRKEYYDARHHCYAFRLGADHSAYRYSDDGEPNNSSGPPIYGQIQAYDLTNILIVVIRYFGGTKLGVGGLINAYKTASKEAIENNSIVSFVVLNHYKIVFEYSETSLVMNLLSKYQTTLGEQSFEAECTITFGVNDINQSQLINDLEVHQIKTHFIGKK
jgi:uncharacterized YigZ family protein